MELDSLQQMGQVYQSKVIYALIKDPTFLKQIVDILKIEYFESEARQWIIESTLNYYYKYKKSITLEVLKSEMIKEDNEILRVDIKNKLKEAYTQAVDDLQYVKDTFLEFCINQNYKIALYKSIDYMKDGEYVKIKLEFDEAAKAGLPNDKGVEVTEETVDEVLANSRTNISASPWPVLNDYIQGGIGDKELIILAAAPGVGKTWLLVNFGYAALLQGKTILHITLELSEDMVAKRYYSLSTKITSANLNENVDKIKHNIKGWPGKLFIKEYPTKRASVNTLSAYIDRMKSDIGNIDMVIVDYADLLKPLIRRADKRNEVGEIYEELRGLAGEHTTKVVTASQLNRASLQADYATGEHIAEDFSKIMIGDLILSVTRKIEDAESKSVRFFMVKNRFGPDNFLIPGKLDVATGETIMYDPNTVEGKKTTDSMKSPEEKDQRLRNMIKQRLGK